MVQRSDILGPWGLALDYGRTVHDPSQTRFGRTAEIPIPDHKKVHRMTPQPAFVLVRPQMGENIGAASRGMWNFGLERMRLVAPRDGWPNPRAVAMSSGAGRLLDAAQVYPTTADAVADCHYVFATTARPRGLTKPVYSPQGAMTEAHARLAQGEKVAVLFGPERSGLENDDIAVANAIVTVPVNPEFASLNLAQCALLMGYEWRRLADQPPARQDELAGGEWSTQIEIEKLADHYEKQLTEAGFFFPETKAAGMIRNLRNFWSRMPLTRADVQMLHGILRQMVRWARHQD